MICLYFCCIVLHSEITTIQLLLALLLSCDADYILTLFKAVTGLVQILESP